MLKHRPAFHAWLVVIGAIYWWLIGWFAPFWLNFVGLIIGRERYNHFQQSRAFTWRHTETSGTVIFGFASACNLVFDILAIIPLYVLWSYWYRRWGSYVEGSRG